MKIKPLKHFKQSLLVVLLIVVYVCCFSISASAEWDGSGLDFLEKHEIEVLFD